MPALSPPPGGAERIGGRHPGLSLVLSRATALSHLAFVALLVVIPLAGALGALLYGGVFRFIVRHGEETRIKNSLLVGFGLALTLQALAVRLFTADERSITTAYRGRALVLYLLPEGRIEWTRTG